MDEQTRPGYTPSPASPPALHLTATTPAFHSTLPSLYALFVTTHPTKKICGNHSEQLRKGAERAQQEMRFYLSS
jgi:hypothetical protein